MGEELQKEPTCLLLIMKSMAPQAVALLWQNSLKYRVHLVAIYRSAHLLWARTVGKVMPSQWVHQALRISSPKR